jgi:hypothetical protein
VRRRLALIPLVIVIVSLVGTTNALAGSRLRTYRGRTSQGLRIQLGFAKDRHGNLALREIEMGDTLTCDDASTIAEAFGIFGFFGPTVSGHKLSLDEVDETMGLHIAGTLHHDSASGTLRINEAALTQSEQAQLCTTGDLTWSAHRAAARVRVFAGYPMRGRIHVHRFGGAVARFGRRRA